MFVLSNEDLEILAVSTSADKLVQFVANMDNIESTTVNLISGEYSEYFEVSAMTKFCNPRYSCFYIEEVKEV